MGRVLLLVGSWVLLACGTDVPPTNPHDPNAPTGVQAVGFVEGTLSTDPPARDPATVFDGQAIQLHWSDGDAVLESPLGAAGRAVWPREYRPPAWPRALSPRAHRLSHVNGDVDPWAYAHVRPPAGVTL